MIAVDTSALIAIIAGEQEAEHFATLLAQNDCLIGAPTQFEAMMVAHRLTSDDLVGFGIVDEIVPEPLGGAHRDSRGTIDSVLSAIDGALARLANVPPGELRARRYDKFRRIGSPA